jgi:hypothetical protein
MIENYYEGAAGVSIDRKSDPLNEYQGQEPMTPLKINTCEPTAVKRDLSIITSDCQTGTNE